MQCNGGARIANIALSFTSPVDAALVFAGVDCGADSVNITIDDASGYFPIGSAFSTHGGRAPAAHWFLTNSLLFQRGSCSRSWPFNTAYTVWGASDGLFANNSVLTYCQGHSTDSSSRLVFDGNTVWSLGDAVSEGDGFSTFEGPQVVEHIYVGRSLNVGNPDAAKRYESMTFDGPGGAAFAQLQSLSSDGTDGQPQTLTLATPGRAPSTNSQGRNISQYIGGSVSVLFGPGMGGMARVVGIVPTNASWSAASVWILDPPLLTRPDATSFVAINPFRGGFIFEGDLYVNSTTWQLWAQATDIVLAGSYFQDMSGDVRNWALFYQCPYANFSCAWQPNVGTDFLYNTLRCSNAINAVTSDYGAVPPVNLTLAIGLTRRGNVLLGNTNMVVSAGRINDVLIEDTTYGPAVCGSKPAPAGTLKIAPGTPNVFVR